MVITEYLLKYVSVCACLTYLRVLLSTPESFQNEGFINNCDSVSGTSMVFTQKLIASKPVRVLEVHSYCKVYQLVSSSLEVF